MAKTKTKSPELTPTELLLSQLDNDEKVPKKLPEELSGVMSISEQIAGTTKKASEQVATHKTKVELEKFKTIASSGDNFPVSPENPFEGFKIPNIHKKLFNNLENFQKEQVLKNFEIAKNSGLDKKNIEKVTKYWIEFFYGINENIGFMNGTNTNGAQQSLEAILNIIKGINSQMVSSELMEKAIYFDKMRNELRDKQIAEADKRSAEADKRSAEARRESAEARKLIKALRELNELLKQNQ